jgi:hypothetical protein
MKFFPNWMTKKPSLEKFSENPTLPGIRLKLGHPEKGWIEIDLSEPVALRWTPWLTGAMSVTFGLLAVAGVTWTFLNYLPSQSTKLPPQAEMQQRKQP